ncbi:MAG: NADH-quinone oxidoreductase subunit N [Chloroflexi bacterium]|nr:NADH-quinone oxidoreductase subunit N [Chloroflexota bacterium]
MIWALLGPELLLAIFALAVILLDLAVKQKGVLAVFSIVGLLGSIGASLALWGTNGIALNNMLVIDKYALFFDVLFAAAAILVILASTDYVEKLKGFQGEYYALILLATTGMMFMASTRELVSIYISLELTSISLYILAGFLKDAKSTEAGLKYLLLGSVSSAVLVYGMALVFGTTGGTHLGVIWNAVKGLNGIADNPTLIMGIVFLVAGFGFKIATVPFQMWVPDVYEGAPTPVTAYLSVASKAAGFAVILRVFFEAFGRAPWLSQSWGMLFAILAAITMTVGNVVAINQTNIKRLLAYSSIAHAGYIMMGLAAVGLMESQLALARSGILFYLAGYGLTNLGAFIAIIAISNNTGSDLIDDYKGMVRRAPVLSLGLAFTLISLTGLPPTAGFVAKIYLFNAALQSGLLWLVIVGVLNSVISAYYYLRVVKTMYLGEPASTERLSSSGPLRVALTASCFGVLFLGVLPNTVIQVTEAIKFLVS